MAPWRTKAHLLPLIFVVLGLFCLPAQAQEFKTYKNDKYGFSLEYPASWKPVKSKPVYEVVLQSPANANDFPNQVNVACQKPYNETIAEAVKKVQKQIQDLREEKDKASKSVKIIQGGAFECYPGAYWLQLSALEPEKNVMMDIVLVYYQQNDVLLRVSCITRQGSLENLFPTFNKVLCSVKFHQAADQAPVGSPTPSPSPSPGAQDDQLEPPAPAPPPSRFPTPSTRTPAPAPAPVTTAPPAESDEDQPAPGTGFLPTAPTPGTRAPAPLPRMQPAPEPMAPGSGLQDQPVEAPRSVPRGPTGITPRPPAPPSPGGIVN